MTSHHVPASLDWQVQRPVYWWHPRFLRVVSRAGVLVATVNMPDMAQAVAATPRLLLAAERVLGEMEGVIDPADDDGFAELRDAVAFARRKSWAS